MEDIAAAKGYTTAFLSQFSHELKLVEKGFLVVVLAATDGLVREMPVGRVHRN